MTMWALGGTGCIGSSKRRVAVGLAAVVLMVSSRIPHQLRQRRDREPEGSVSLKKDANKRARTTTLGSLRSVTRSKSGGETRLLTCTPPLPAVPFAAYRNASGNSDTTDQQEAMLPWLPWEVDSMANGTCLVPSHVPRRCCVGTTSSGGQISVSPLCLSKGTVRRDPIVLKKKDGLLWGLGSTRCVTSSYQSYTDACPLFVSLILGAL